MHKIPCHWTCEDEEEPVEREEQNYWDEAGSYEFREDPLEGSLLEAVE